MKSHDLNALTLRIAQEKGITFAEARQILAQRAAAARQAAKVHFAAQERRAENARRLADRIAP